ncbi:MAG: redox-regulated ATPase YchF [Deltaproteobacteria bacterium]
MSLACGIVGLPNVGKSTLFNAISETTKAEAANYPFCTIEPNVGVVGVPDERLAKLAALYRPKKTTPTTLDFVDIAGLVKGASKGEGLGNQFLSHIRQVQAVIHVVRCFTDSNVIHVEGSIDPERDVAVIDTELCLKDLETVEKRRERTQKASKGVGKPAEEAKLELALLDRIKAGLDAGKPLRAQGLTAEEGERIADLFALTGKPVLYVANVDEAQLKDPDQDPNVQKVRRIAEREGAKAIVICAGLESEIATLPPGERGAFLAESGLAEPGLNRLVRAGYELLGLLTFFTAGEDECRAWTVRRGARAPEAAGVIHTDFERGFIKAEIARVEELLAYGSEAALRDKGLLRIEGKEYVVQDGDVAHFRFNV